MAEETEGKKLRAARIQVQITEDTSALLDRLSEITSMSRVTLGAMALATGAAIIGKSLDVAISGRDPFGEGLAVEMVRELHSALGKLEEQIGE